MTRQMIVEGTTRVRVMPGILGTVRTVIDPQRIDVDWDDGLTTSIQVWRVEIVADDARIATTGGTDRRGLANR